MVEKKVHVCVEFGIDLYDHNYTQLPHQSDHVDRQENQEEEYLKVWVFWEAQEDERDHGVLISLTQYHGYWFTKRKKKK